MLSRETSPRANGSERRATSNGISRVIGPVKTAEVLTLIGSDRSSSPDGGVATANGDRSPSRAVMPVSVTRSKVTRGSRPVSPGAATETVLPRTV